MSEAKAQRAVVIGASGIGKYHAEWWSRLGADLRAFAGSTPESVAKTTEKLRDLFGFAGRGYADIAEMLAAEKPAFVDVCSPPRLHIAHVTQALKAGCHVLCEKPLCYAKGELVADQLRAARAAADLARASGLNLGLCTQYGVVGAFCLEQFQAAAGAALPKRFHGWIASPAKAPVLDPVDIWADLAPHMIGAFQNVAPGVAINWETLQTRFEGDVAEAEFEAGGIQCRITTEKRREAPNHIRRVVLDDQSFDLDDVKDETGVLRSRVVRGDDEWMIPNVLRETIRHFMEGTPVFDAAGALQNHEACMGVLRRVVEG